MSLQGYPKANIPFIPPLCELQQQEEEEEQQYHHHQHHHHHHPHPLTHLWSDQLFWRPPIISADCNTSEGWFLVVYIKCGLSTVKVYSVVNSSSSLCPKSYWKCEWMRLCECGNGCQDQNTFSCWGGCTRSQSSTWKFEKWCFFFFLNTSPYSSYSIPA